MTRPLASVLAFAAWLVTAQNGVTRATFELQNQQAGYIRTGTSRLVAVSAWATHTNNQPPFGSEGIELRLFTVPITPADRPDLLAGKTNKLEKGGFVAFILFIDKAGKIAQVNMSYIVPGTTVARTVASTAQELAKFSDFKFDGKRLQLKSKGTFSELNEKKEALSLSWDLEIDLQVVERAGK